MPKITTVQPLGEQRQRLIANIGQTSWQYTGSPETGYVSHKGRRLKVWLFDFDQIEPIVQEHAVKETARIQGVTPTAARKWLQSVPFAIPCAQALLIESGE